MKKTTFRHYLVGDFETTVYDKQNYTEVWAGAVVAFHSEDVKIFHSIDETFKYIVSFNTNICIYFHNLKFDGQFWLPYLLFQTKLKQAIYTENNVQHFYENDEMPNNSFKYLISDMGQWYTITIKIHNKIIEIRDSLKLLPFSVREIGKSFKTKHQKLEMEYTGFRYAGCEITDEEKQYIANDVLVVKEALEIMFAQGFKKLTIGSCALAEFRKTFIGGKNVYKGMLPDVSEIKLDKEKYGSENVDEYVRKSYKGGWCYVVKGKECKIFHNGVTADVNSLYPSMMHSESGNYYPVGLPKFWKGNYIHPYALQNDDFGNPHYYFIRILTEFKLKPNKLPCIQIKHNMLYKPREWLETSDVKLSERTLSNGKKMSEKVMHNRVELTLTQTDFELINDHYDLYNLEILDGCYFSTEKGLFDYYIDKYKKIKLESTGAVKQTAKLALNNLYGKLATSKDSSFKVAIPNEDGTICFQRVNEHNKKTVYIPMGSAITSYARNFTIRTAQANYYGKDKRGFIYADTDSIHCDLSADELKNVKIHDKDFCCWKLEANWSTGWFVRPKTYIEHVTHENQVKIENEYDNIKCAGMSENCKEFFRYSMLGRTKNEWETKYKEVWDKLHDEEKAFVLQKRNIEDFNIGLKVVGKLIPKRIKGGVILCSTTYEMR